MNKKTAELARQAGFIGLSFDNTVMGTSYDKALENFADLIRAQYENISKITEEKEAWYVMVNTDLTEGRGWTYSKFACEKQSTALRLSKKADVQGSDARIRKGIAVKIDNNWHYEGYFYTPSLEDLKAEKLLEEQTEQQRRRNEVLERAKALGLSEDDLAVIRG